MHVSKPDKAETIKLIKVFVVDDHPILLEGLQITIRKHPNFHLCGSASSIREALDKIKTAKPDVLVSDIKLKDESGIELVEEVKKRIPSIRIVMMSMHDESYFIEKSLKAGANGYVLKSESTNYVLEAVEAVYSGNRYLSPGVEAKLLNKILDANEEDASFKNIDQLSARELEIFQLMGKGKSAKDIAGVLSISPRTVDTHKENIKKKLHKYSMNEVLETAIEWTKLK